MRSIEENRIRQGEKLLVDHGSRYDLPADFVIGEMQKVLSAQSEAERAQKLFEQIGRIFSLGVSSGYRMSQNDLKRAKKTIRSKFVPKRAFTE